MILNDLVVQIEKKIKKLNINNFLVDCDIVTEDEERDARFKITAKHIAGIKEWNPTDKRVFYDNLFTQYRGNGKSCEDAIKAIENITPETGRKIKNALLNQRFLYSIYTEVKKKHPALDSLSHLDTDVLISRVQKRIKDVLGLTITDDLFFESKPGKELDYGNILNALGEATWIGKTLNTRTFNTRNMWDKILEEDKIVPGLKNLIQKYLLENTVDNKKNSNEDAHLEKTIDKQKGVMQSSNSEQSSAVVNSQTNNNNENVDNKHKNYRLFLSKQYIEVQDINYLLTENVEILDEQNNNISKSSSMFKKLIFSTEGKNIALKDNRILPISENGKYTIKVNFYNTEKKFSLFLKIPKKHSNMENSKDLFSERWFTNSVALLSPKEEYINIISVLKCLNENKDIYRSSDNFVMLSFLIRILIEYTSKAYWDKYNPLPKSPSSLPTYINNISNDLFNKNIITKEEKKSFSNGSDLEQLNGQIHDYKSNISSIAIASIFKEYKNYLDKLFLELNK